MTFYSFNTNHHINAEITRLNRALPQVDNQGNLTQAPVGIPVARPADPNQALVDLIRAENAKISAEPAHLSGSYQEKPAPTSAEQETQPAPEAD